MAEPQNAQELAAIGVQRIEEHHQKMLAYYREIGDEQNLRVQERMYETWKKYPEHQAFFGLMLMELDSGIPLNEGRDDDGLAALSNLG